jgi:hypothetical protein
LAHSWLYFRDFWPIVGKDPIPVIVAGCHQLFDLATTCHLQGKKKKKKKKKVISNSSFYKFLESFYLEFEERY